MTDKVKSFYRLLTDCVQSGGGGWIFAAAAVSALLLRFAVSRMGWNYDYESYEIVTGIMEQGKCVYAETSRYNYGPVWFHVLHLFKLFCGTGFRGGIIFFLTCCDWGIAAILWHRKYRFAALLFLLSPITIYTTGYHNQFDNFAVTAAMLSVLLLTAPSEDKDGEPSLWRTFSGACLLGISLMIKHIFIFFAFWLFLRFKDPRRKLLVLLVPALIFCGGFLPYVLPEIADAASGKQLVAISRMMLKGDFNGAERQREVFFSSRPVCRGIWQNVVLYRSYNNKIFHTWCLPKFLQVLIPAEILFFGGMLLLGFLFRKTELFTALLCYTGVLLILSTAITNQYLAIPAALAAVFAWPFGIFYHALALGWLFRPSTYSGPVYLLAVLLLILIFIPIAVPQWKGLMRKISGRPDDH